VGGDIEEQNTSEDVGEADDARRGVILGAVDDEDAMDAGGRQLPDHRGESFVEIAAD